MKKAFFNWSSGKDSALAFYNVLQNSHYEVTSLVTTVNSLYDRVSMHGLRNKLLELQALSIGLPLHKIELHGNISMAEYSAVMQKEMEVLGKGNEASIFGDIFLEDLRTYRESQLSAMGLEAIFPLWKKDTKKLIDEFLTLGFKAITVCVNAKYLDESFVGKIIDHAFIDRLPDGVDPCGENGEFHTFVYDGPIFKKPVPFKIGEKVYRNYIASGDDNDQCFSDDVTWDTGFWYCDLLPA